MPRSMMTPEQAAETAFAVFLNPKCGFRAMGIVFLNYERVHGLNTIDKIFDRYAPPNENPTQAYKDAVSKKTGVLVDAPYDLRIPANLEAIMQASAEVEAGGWFFQMEDLQEGAALALGA